VAEPLYMRRTAVDALQARIHPLPHAIETRSVGNLDGAGLVTQLRTFHTRNTRLFGRPVRSRENHSANISSVRHFGHLTLDLAEYVALAVGFAVLETRLDL
jgi:hypothetical protein